MPTSNKNDAKSISKLALLASAAATAAFVVSQSKLMQRLTEPAEAPPASPSKTPALIEELTPVSPVEELPEEPTAPEDIESEDTGHDGDNGHGDNGHSYAPPAPSGGSRIRVRATRPARERLHYGLPVRSQRTQPSRAARRRSEEAASVAVMEPPAPEITTTPEFDNEEFDAEYIAICEAIAHDGRLNEAEVDVEVEPEPELEPAVAVTSTQSTSVVTATRDAIEDMWWLPAPRLRYILVGLAYVAGAAIVGSDPVTLAVDGLHALGTVNSAADFVLLGWILCGALLIIPLGGLVTRVLSFATLGRVQGISKPFQATGWSIRLLATSVFIAGAVLYSPHALRWALNTDYPVAAVSTSSMSPTLHEGELVLIDGVGSINDIDIGDIIAFKQAEGLAVLRVTGFENDAIVAQADAQDQSFVVPFEAVTGRVLTLAGTQVKLPLLGNISLLGERTVEPVATTIGLP